MVVITSMKKHSSAPLTWAPGLIIMLILACRTNAFFMVTSQQPKIASPAVFNKDFTRPMGLPEQSIEAAVGVLRSGRLNRYSCASADTSQVSLLEQEIVEATGVQYALGVNSCSSAILIALLSVGVKPGDEVISNAFTFTAVPSSILRIGAEPVLVECLDR